MNILKRLFCRHKKGWKYLGIMGGIEKWYKCNQCGRVRMGGQI